MRYQVWCAGEGGPAEAMLTFQAQAWSCRERLTCQAMALVVALNDQERELLKHADEQHALRPGRVLSGFLPADLTVRGESSAFS